jgi:predicted PurR-regulated permease PerM
MVLEEFTQTQKRALAVLTVIALVFGAYFLGSFFILIVGAAVAAYLSTPLFTRLQRRFGVGLSATLTLLAVVAIVAIPIGLGIFLAVLQVSQMVNQIGRLLQENDLSKLGVQVLDSVNGALGKIPLAHIELTQEGVRRALARVGETAGHTVLGFLRDSVGGLALTVALSIIFLYVYIALLTSGSKVLTLFKHMNPLGEQVSDLYLAKAGAMVKATVRGQFIIALCQGVAGALSIYIAGIHDGFFMFVILLTTLAFIPLGSGIVTIPLGIGMALFGHVIGGLFIALFHIIGVSNIDNALRPFLVPKEAHLHPALMLLSVFAGLRMFGFWGIVLGPVIMIIIVTTISVYLEVYRGVAMESPEAAKPAKRKWLRRLAGKPASAKSVSAETVATPAPVLTEISAASPPVVP